MNYLSALLYRKIVISLLLLSYLLCFCFGCGRPLRPKISKVSPSEAMLPRQMYRLKGPVSEHWEKTRTLIQERYKHILSSNLNDPVIDMTISFTDHSNPIISLFSGILSFGLFPRFYWVEARSDVKIIDTDGTTVYELSGKSRARLTSILPLGVPNDIFRRNSWAVMPAKKHAESLAAIDVMEQLAKAEPTIIAKLNKRPDLAPIPKPMASVEYDSAKPAKNLSSRQCWAVLVGVAEYELAGKGNLTNLLYADDDADAFSAALKNQKWKSSHIKLLTNKQATKRNIEVALESWLTKANPEDLIVLYWSGHGFPDPENSERVYFACYDTDVSIPATGYRMDRVRAALEERKARNVILLADTCHAGKLITRGNKGISIVPQIDKMRRDKSIPDGWIFMVGADTDRQAIEHTSWSNGAFTHCLVKGLSGCADGFENSGLRDGIVTMGELRIYLFTEMPNQTQRVLGTAKRPVIMSSSGDKNIWELSLMAK
jgi:hypothetical protein